MGKTVDITLLVAHRIRSLTGTGLTQQQVADELGLNQATVSRVLTGKGLVRARALADRMEVFLGGAIIGSGNTRFHAASPKVDNDDGHAARRSQHTLGTSYENSRPVSPAADPLAELLAEEDILERLAEAGISADEILHVDHLSDVEVGSVVGGFRLKRDADIHLETWDEFMQRAEADGIADRPGAIMKRLENEGVDVDVWSVRDVDFMGWPAGPWSTATTNRSIT